MSVTEAVPAAPSAPATKSLGTEPVDWPVNVKSYLEDFITTVMPTSAAFQVLAQKMAYPVGFPRLIMEDLTANTSEYVWTDPVTGLGYLYCNGAAVSQTTYADLYAQWGASKWAADSGGNFSLPDTRGRSLWLCGTNANTDLGDTDGVSEASREPKHTHTSTSLTVTGAPSLGTLALTFNGVITAGTGIAAGTDLGTTTNPITGAPGLGTLDVGGTAGSGMSGSDAVAHIVIGSLVVRF